MPICKKCDVECNTVFMCMKCKLELCYFCYGFQQAMSGNVEEMSFNPLFCCSNCHQIELVASNVVDAITISAVAKLSQQEYCESDDASCSFEDASENLHESLSHQSAAHSSQTTASGEATDEEELYSALSTDGGEQLESMDESNPADDIVGEANEGSASATNQPAA